MKNKHLLLLTLLLSQSTSVWGMMGSTDPVDELHKTIKQSVNKTINNPDYQKNAPKVIFIGDTGRGKTSLIHYLAEKDLISSLKHGSYIVDVKPGDLLPNFDPIGTTVNAGTTFPASWTDSQNNVVYWDCPGFRDPGGSVQEIANAFAIHQLLKSSTPLKIVLVASEDDAKKGRSKNFLELLQRVSEVLPNNVSYNGISLVLSQQRTVDAHQLVQDIFSEVSKSTTHAFNSGPVNDLLKALSTQGRSVAFPEPTQAGVYPDVHRTPILTNISNLTPVLSPTVNFTISPPAQLLVANYAQKLNDKIIDLIKIKGLQKTIGFCDYQIDQNVNNVKWLRKQLGNVELYLDGLKNGLLQLPLLSQNQITGHLATLLAPNAMSFFPTKKLRGMIETLSFLKSIDPNINYATNAWAHNINTIGSKIQELTKDPKVKVKNGVLTLKGFIVGASDVVTALQQHRNLPHNNINVFGLNTLFLDQDITSRGTSCNFIAPKWKVLGKKVIDLTGLDGAPGSNGLKSGADGQVGMPGGNGGNFSGALFSADGLHHLALRVDGGIGGKGGDGSRGSDGSDGSNGNLYKVTRKEDYSHIKLTPDSHSSYTWTTSTIGYREYYEDKGTDGSPGKDGGRSGKGGVGGKNGLIVCQGFLASDLEKFISGDGSPGRDGKEGLGGTGGRHGNHCEGIKLTNLLESYKVDSWCCPYGWHNIGYDYRPINDKIETSVQFQGSRGSASNGKSYKNPHTNGQRFPVAQTLLSKAALIGYKPSYQKAKSNNVAPEFVRNFPNL